MPPKPRRQSKPDFSREHLAEMSAEQKRTLREQYAAAGREKGMAQAAELKAAIEAHPENYPNTLLDAAQTALAPDKNPVDFLRLNQRWETFQQEHSDMQALDAQQTFQINETERLEAQRQNASSTTKILQKMPPPTPEQQAQMEMEAKQAAENTGPAIDIQPKPSPSGNHVTLNYKDEKNIEQKCHLSVSETDNGNRTISVNDDISPEQSAAAMAKAIADGTPPFDGMIQTNENGQQEINFLTNADGTLNSLSQDVARHLKDTIPNIQINQEDPDGKVQNITNDITAAKNTVKEVSVTQTQSSEKTESAQQEQKAENQAQENQDNSPSRVPTPKR